jgi:hypothetical protein
VSVIRICDTCGAPVNENSVTGDDSWVQAAVSIAEPISDGGHPKDYHRACARTITLAQVWARPGMAEL